MKLILTAGAALQAVVDRTVTVRWKTAAGFVELDGPTVLAVATAVRAHDRFPTLEGGFKSPSPPSCQNPFTAEPGVSQCRTWCRATETLIYPVFARVIPN